MSGRWFIGIGDIVCVAGQGLRWMVVDLNESMPIVECEREITPGRIAYSSFHVTALVVVEKAKYPRVG